MAYYNRYKDVEIALPDVPHGGFDGEFELEAFKGTEFPKGSGIIYETPGTRRKLGRAVHPNLITNNGLDWYGAYRTGSGWSASLGTTSNRYYQANYCHVGTGTATPSVSDTALASFTAGAAWNAGLGLGSYWAQGSPPYYGSHRHWYRFNAGFAGGAVNLNEVGVGFTITTGNLTARALTVNGSGVPTTVTVLADEYLDVYYTRRNYPGLIADESLGTYSEQSGTVDIDGTTYNYTMRPIAVTNNDWGQSSERALGFTGPDGFGTGSYQKGLVVFDQTTAHVAITSTHMTGSYAASYNGVGDDYGMGSYTTGTYTRTIWYKAGIDSCNVNQGGVYGFKGFKIMSSLGTYQVLLDGVVPKTSTKVYTYYHQWTWARH